MYRLQHEDTKGNAAKLRQYGESPYAAGFAFAAQFAVTI
jgi:hypothetical protein